MSEPITMSASEIGPEDEAAVLSVLRSGRLALGPATRRFEEALAAYVGTKHAIAASSGTAALHMLVRALDLRRGDEVLVPSFTFAASVNALLYEGVKPVFVDIESETYNLDPRELELRMTPRTKAIMAVDVFGHPVDWDAIEPFARARALKVIDDSCEALGARHGGRNVGTFGDAAAFAFYPNKQMTTGEGGMVVTDDDHVARVCRSLANQGRAEHGAWLEHERLGYNYRIDEMSAALGASQLERLESFIARRERVARAYTRRLSGLGWVRPPVVRRDVRMSWFVYVVTLAPEIDRDAVMRSLEKEGIPTRAYFSPIHTQPYLRAYVDKLPVLPVTEDVARRTLALPFHNNLSEQQIERVVGALEQAVKDVAGAAA